MVVVPVLMVVPVAAGIPPEELEDELLDELELLDEELLDELDELELDEEELLEDEELVVAPYEHQAELVKLLAGKAEPVQAKLPVLVAYTNAPDLPSATERVPVIVQVAPVFCTHLV